LVCGQYLIQALRKPVVVEVGEDIVNPIVLKQILLYAWPQNNLR